MKLFYAACALVLAAADKELEAFSYTVSHDLRAPLRAMQAFSTSVLADSGELLNDKGRHRLGRIQANAQNMSRLVDGLLAFSRLGRKPLDKRSVAVGRVVRRALDELSAEREGRRVDISVGELPDCQADPALLRQVFVNLLDNALKFTGKREVARIEIGCQTVNGEHRYFIKDNGAGFDMRYADKLFGVFQRLHSPGEYEGTGVGLANVQRIIHRHGGRVWAEAEVDRGATFYFTVKGDSQDEQRSR
jgi:light-regulated signal transduction histidine kinase (bacteriophytochrome)